QVDGRKHVGIAEREAGLRLAARRSARGGDRPWGFADRDGRARPRRRGDKSATVVVLDLGPARGRSALARLPLEQSPKPRAFVGVKAERDIADAEAGNREQQQAGEMRRSGNLRISDEADRGVDAMRRG